MAAVDNFLDQKAEPTAPTAPSPSAGPPASDKAADFLDAPAPPSAVASVAARPSTPSWNVLYSGLDGLEDKLPDQQKATFLPASYVLKDPKEGWAKAINQSYLQSHLPAGAQSAMALNWPAFRSSYAQQTFGRPVNSDTELYNEISRGFKADRGESMAAMEAEYGIIRAQTAWEKIKFAFDRYSPFGKGPKAAPANVPGVKAQWSDLPHILGGMVAETMLDPGNILTGVIGGAAGEAVQKAVSRVFGAYMVGSFAKNAPSVYREWRNPDVSGAQATADTIGEVTTGALGALGVMSAFLPGKEINAGGPGDGGGPGGGPPSPTPPASASILNDIRDRPAAEAAKNIQGHAAQAATPTEQAVIDVAAEAVRDLDLRPAAEKESIKAAAIKTPEGNIVEGDSHETARKQLPEGPPKGSEEGFTTSTGRFVPRDEAARIAQDANQLTEAAAKAPPEELHSEDVETLRRQAPSARTEPPQTLKQQINSNLGRITGMMETRMAQREFYKGQEQAASGAARLTAKQFRTADAQGQADADAIRGMLLKTLETLPYQERGRFTQMIADATRRPAIGRDMDGMYRRSMLVNFRMLARADEVAKMSVVAEIKDTIDRATRSPSVDVEYKKRIDRTVNRVALTGMTENTRANLEATRDYIAAKGENHGVPDEVVHQLERLGQIPARELPMNVLEALRDRVQLLEKLGRTTVKSREALYNAERAELAKQIQAGDGVAISAPREARAPGEEISLSDRVRMAISNAAKKAAAAAATTERALLGRDIVMDIMDGGADYRGPLNRIFGGRVDANYNAEMELRKGFQSVLDPVLDEYSYSELERKRISIYAAARQPNGIQHLLDSGVRPETIRQVQASITPKELALYQATRQLGDEYIYPALKKMMRDLYSIEVERVPDYSPFQRDWALIERRADAPKLKTESGQEVGYDELATWRQLEQDFQPRKTTKAEQGMTISRQADAGGAIQLDYLEAWNRHISQVAHLLANQRDLKMLGEIARSDAFAKKYGDLGQQYILNFLDTVSRNSDPAGATRIGVVDWLNRNSAVGVLGFRLLSQLKHAPNLALGLAEVRPDFLAAGIKEALTPEGWSFANRNFAEIAQRWGGEPAIADIGDRTTWRHIQQGSFFLERAFDSTIARGTVIGRYMQELHAQGIDPSRYHQIPVDTSGEAWRMALVTSRKVVTSPLLKDLPQAISRGALLNGQMSLSRAFFQFQNTVLRQYGYARHDIWDLGVRRLNVGRAMTGSLAILGLLAGESTIIQANRKMLRGLSGTPALPGEKTQSFEQDFASEALRRVPFAGNVLAMRFGDTGIPIESIWREMGQAGWELAQGKDQYDRKLSPREKSEAKAALAGSAAEALGVPGAGTAEQLYRSTIPSKQRNINTRFRP